MALILEDGTGLVDSNAYADIAFANQYFAERGMDQAILAEYGQNGGDLRVMWSGDTSQKEGALIRATDHIEAVYGNRFLSAPLTTTQALSFPRVEWPEVPLRVRKACAEYALHALGGSLLPQEQTEYRQETSGKVIRKREKIGPIEEETEYAPEGAIIKTEIYTPKSYPTADLYLSPFIKPIPDHLNPIQSVQWRRYLR